MASVNQAHRATTAVHFGGVFDGGNLVIRDADVNVVATFPLDADAFALLGGGTLSALGLPKTQTAAMGVVDIEGAELQSSDGLKLITNLSVKAIGTGGTANVWLDTLSPANGDTLRLVQLIITRSANVDQ